jgi:hypothetical protein
MKRLIIIGIIVISFIIFASCDQMAIEDAIQTFEDAVNSNSDNEMKNILSPDSQQYIIGAWDIFQNYFDGQRDVNYTNLEINMIDGENARVFTDATYSDIVPVPGGVKFRMRKDESDSTFFMPSWKVYQYYDNGNFVEDTDAIWKKLRRKN